MLPLSTQTTTTRQYLIPMTDASFKAAGHAVLTEDHHSQKFTSTRKTCAAVAYG